MSMAIDESGPSKFESDMAKVRTRLQAAQHVFVVTGAGMSAESGVPTFRGVGERWRDKHFTELASPAAFQADPREIWDWYLYRRQVVASCEPNIAHRRLAEWAQQREGVSLATQNVDGLHELAGHPDVLRLHGSLWHNRCTACGLEREERSLAYPELPLSPCCQALERPAIVWFGEMLPGIPMVRAQLALRRADVLLVIGTSGEVSTVHHFVYDALMKYKAYVVDINPEDGLITSNIDLRDTAGRIIPALLAP